MDIESIPNVNYLWAYLVIEELYRTGVRNVFIAPGSRSTPLTLTAAAHTGLKKTVHFDERGLAFYALGLISAAGNPAVLISTAGTAAANFFPAVIEASKKKLPLIIFTADRPTELRKTGAHQTIDQPEIFGKYVRWSIDMPAPDSKIDPKYILSTIDQAVSRTRGELPGPVHINYMFREPLAPEKEKFDCNFDLIKKWAGKKEPFTTYINPEKSIPVHTIKETAEILNRSE